MVISMTNRLLAVVIALALSGLRRVGGDPARQRQGDDHREQPVRHADDHLNASTSAYPCVTIATFHGPLRHRSPAGRRAASTGRHNEFTAEYGGARSPIVQLAARRGQPIRGSHGSVLSTSVTGPSFTRSTAIWAPKEPVSTVSPLARRRETKRSSSGRPCSGRAAWRKLGRFCPRASANNVNCDTTTMAACTCAALRLNFPASSLNTRSFRILSAR